MGGHEAAGLLEEENGDTGVSQTQKLRCKDNGCGLLEDQADVSERSSAKKQLLLAIGLAVIFMLVEVAGGLYSNSLAVLTDAAHLLSDIAGFAISLSALWMGSWPATRKYSFGYHRSEILGAFLSIQLVWLITAILVYEAIHRLFFEEGKVDGRIMFSTAAFGVIVNLIMALIFAHKHDHPLSPCGHGGGHDHGHNHSHQKSTLPGPPHKVSIVVVEKKGYELIERPQIEEKSSGDAEGKCKGNGENNSNICNGHGHEKGHHHHHHHHHNTGSEHSHNVNLRAAYLHVLGDLAQSTGVMIAGAVIWAKPEWRIVDLICTMFFSVIVISTTVRIIQDILRVLMQCTPKAVDVDKLEQRLLQLPGVAEIHCLHTWEITLGKAILACHIRLVKGADPDKVLKSVAQVCNKEFRIRHTTIQLEQLEERTGQA